jgi:hypothetical protein
MAETNIKILKIEVDTGTGVIKVNGVTKSIKEATAATKEFASSAGEMKKATKDLGSSAGLAGATVNELGRTISDMPYGITAVSNNISQLGSLFAILVSKTGSVNNAIKSLFQTLKASPALVVLLAFQAIVAIVDVIAQNAKKTQKAVKGLSQAVAESATELKIARDILNDSTASFERKEKILTQVNGKYKDLKLSLDENGEATRESTSALDEQISSLEKLAKSQAIVIQVQKIYGEMALLNTKTGAEASDILDKTYATILNLGNELQLIYTLGVLGDRGGDYYAKKIEELGEITRQKQLAEQKKTADALIKQIESLFPPKDPKDLSSKSLEDFNLLLIKSQIGYLASIDTNNEEYQIRLLNQTTDLRLKELNITKEAAVKKAKEEGRSNEELLVLSTIYENKRQAILLDSNSKLMDIMKSFNKELKAEVMKMSDFTSEEQKDLNVLNKIFGTDVKTAEDQLKDYSNKLIKGLADYQKRREDAERNGNEAVAKARYQDMLAAVWTAQDLSNGVFAVMDASFQREIDIEQDKTNKINNELRERIANENISADERRNIQNRIAANDEVLRKKQEEIEKKKFKLNKAASLANATINTYLAATAALKDPALSTFQRIASMVAIIGSGLAQVAMIAKQKFVSSQSGLSGGVGLSGGNNGVQSPEFNIVGQSASNQIAAAVQGQFSQPIRAYVVSKDMSTAQEMDRNIIGASSLG